MYVRCTKASTESQILFWSWPFAVHVWQKKVRSILHITDILWPYEVCARPRETNLYKTAETRSYEPSPGFRRALQVQPNSIANSKMKLLILLGLIAVAAAYPTSIQQKYGPGRDCVIIEYDLGYTKIEFEACDSPRKSISCNYIMLRS